MAAAACAGAANAVSRWVFLVVNGFFENQCLIRASALTFTTILPTVPFLAVAFSSSKGFSIQDTEFVRGLLLRITGERAEVVKKILTYIANTNVKTLGWLGVVTLLATVFSMVGTVEKAFNKRWTGRRISAHLDLSCSGVFRAVSDLVSGRRAFTLTNGRFGFVEDTFASLRQAAAESPANETLAWYAQRLEPETSPEAVTPLRVN